MVRLRLLGETAIDVDGTPVGPESQVLFAVLLVLALERGKRIARPALHRLLWPDADEDSGRHNLRQVLYKLRQLGAPLEATQSSVMLPAAQVAGELVELTGDPGAIGARLLSGRRVGDLLPGYAPGFSAAFADWVDEQRALLHAQLRRALLGALADARTLGQWREVEAIAREVLRFDPLNEEATLALAESTALAGAKAQAIGIIDRYLDEIGGRGADLRVPATVLRRRIAERFPAHRYVSAADACFVGRATEMAELLRLWHRARERRGGAALLWGEPGIGKTRLAHELGKVAVLQGAQVQRVASRSWDVHRPLGAIVDLVPSLRELPGAAGIDPRCHEYLDRLTKHDPARALADLPDPATLHRQVRQAVFDLIEALLAEAPLVLVFEDVQWLDASSWEVLAELLRLARTRRLLLVLTSRVLQPPQQPESADWEALRRIRVGGLETAATHELLDAMTREAGRYIDPEYREWCVPLANGNPLHVQEIALQWLEKGSVREAPGSLRAMVEARIEKLDPTALTLLQLIAILAHRASLNVLRASAVFAAKELLEAIDALAKGRLLVCTGATITASHPLMTEFALKHAAPARIALLHQIAARVIEPALDGVIEGGAIWDCAEHWLAAGEQDRAVAMITRCAGYMLDIGLPHEALDVIGRATQLHLSSGERSNLTSLKVIGLAQVGRWDNVISELENTTRALAVTRATTGPTLLRLFEARWRRHEDLSPTVSDALALASSSLHDPTTRLRAATLAVIFCDNLCDHSAYAPYERLIDDILSDSSLDPLERDRHLMIRAACSGRVDEAITHARAVVCRAAQNLARADHILALRHAALAFRYGGLIEDARDLLLQVLEEVRRQRLPDSAIGCMNSLAVLALHAHDVEEAQAWGEQIRSTTTDGQNLVALYGSCYVSAQVAAATNDRDALRTAVQGMGNPSEADSNRRRHIARVGSALRLGVLEGRDRHDIERLLHACRPLVARVGPFGQADFAAAACARALQALGRDTDCRSFVSDYCTRVRLERGKLHLDLAAVATKYEPARPTPISSGSMRPTRAAELK